MKGVVKTVIFINSYGLNLRVLHNFLNEINAEHGDIFLMLIG